MRPARIVFPPQPFGDGVVALRRWRDEDLTWLVEALQTPEIPRWTRMPYPYRETDGRSFLARRDEEARHGLAAHFAIVEAPDGPPLGGISLQRFAWEHERADVGYWVSLPAQGRGVATRALRLACDFGFRTLGLQRIGLQAAAANLASQTVAERGGFTREALLRSWQAGGDGRRADYVAFGRLVTD
jgi:RimJ/RimL family protein N-acetyltransferase